MAAQALGLSPWACFFSRPRSQPSILRPSRLKLFLNRERRAFSFLRSEIRHLQQPAIVLFCRQENKAAVLDMLPWRITRFVVRSIDSLAERFLPPDGRPKRHQVGARGEEDAYFHLRKLGYVMVARNFRSPRCHGEIDLIGWDQDVLCFVEVKTRTSTDIKPAEAAVDRYKRREVAEVAREYLRQIPPSCPWRFDVVSVYYSGSNSRPQFEVFRNSSLAR